MYKPPTTDSNSWQSASGSAPPQFDGHRDRILERVEELIRVPDLDFLVSAHPLLARQSLPISRVLAGHRPQDEAKALRHAVADRLRSCLDLSEGRVTVILCARLRGGM